MPARTAAPLASEDREVLRLAGPVVLWWVWLAFVAANVVDVAVQGLSSARFGAVVSAVLLLVTALAYTLALRPRVIADGAGLTVVNPFRTHHVPWRLIQSVDTGEWVRVRYAPPEGADSADSADGADGAETRTVHCWALYVSARARRKIARGNPGPRRGYGVFGGGFAGGFGRASRAAEAVSGYASSDGSGRLPEEARRLAAMPVAEAMASRLDTRAARERARRPRLGQEPDRGGMGGEQPPMTGDAIGRATDQATTSWAWLALAAVGIPVLVLLIVVVA